MARAGPPSGISPPCPVADVTGAAALMPADLPPPPPSLQVVAGGTTTATQEAAGPAAVGFEVLTDSSLFRVHPGVSFSPSSNGHISTVPTFRGGLFNASRYLNVTSAVRANEF